jgi:hypothetical protein
MHYQYFEAGVYRNSSTWLSIQAPAYAFEFTTTAPLLINTSVPASGMALQLQFRRVLPGIAHASIPVSSIPKRENP